MSPVPIMQIHRRKGWNLVFSIHLVLSGPVTALSWNDWEQVARHGSNIVMKSGAQYHNPWLRFLLILDLLGPFLSWLEPRRRSERRRKADECQDQEYWQQTVEKRSFPVEFEVHINDQLGAWHRNSR
jgi:hypothetical protein